MLFFPETILRGFFFPPFIVVRLTAGIQSFVFDSKCRREKLLRYLDSPAAEVQGCKDDAANTVCDYCSNAGLVKNGNASVLERLVPTPHQTKPRKRRNTATDDLLLATFATVAAVRANGPLAQRQPQLLPAQVQQRACAKVHVHGPDLRAKPARPHKPFVTPFKTC